MWNWDPEYKAQVLKVLLVFILIQQLFCKPTDSNGADNNLPRKIFPYVHLLY